MCGIIGYTGEKQTLPVLLDGLKSLEYRGYDSAGVAFSAGGKIVVVKKKGRVSELEKQDALKKVFSRCGIGHTRWATHGEPSDENSHPHSGGFGRVTVVHNGIIENYSALKRELTDGGVIFASETDTEVVTHLVYKYYESGIKNIENIAECGDLRSVKNTENNNENEYIKNYNEKDVVSAEGNVKNIKNNIKNVENDTEYIKTDYQNGENHAENIEDNIKIFHSAVRRAVGRLKGTYAIAVLCADFPDVVVAAAHSSPLVVGASENGSYLASDAAALFKYTDFIYRLSDGETAILRPHSAEFFSDGGEPVEKSVERGDFGGFEAELNGAESFMLKEINEIPAALKRTLEYYEKNFFKEQADEILAVSEATSEPCENDILKKKTDLLNAEVNEKPDALTETSERRESSLSKTTDLLHAEIDEKDDALTETPECGKCNIFREKNDFFNAEKIFIVGCGTAYHAALLGRALIEKIARVPVETDIASEFRYRDPIIPKNSLCIFISQSGETADTLAAARLAKAAGAATACVTNVKNSAITAVCDATLPTLAGPEIAVASTKAYNCQLLAMYLSAFFIARKKGKISAEKFSEYLKTLKIVAEKAAAKYPEIPALAARYKDEKDIYFLGRGPDYFTALEAALKLKEISYIHAEAYASGELKHGALALVENETPVVAILTQGELLPKSVNSIEEVKARKGRVLGIGKAEYLASEVFDERVVLPDVPDLFLPLLSVVPTQLFAYYIARYRGCDADKPRNLAKSVTVE
jgi:glucosamine--fructose-6-phosphate aminotransferase (isomerizing)